MPKRLLVLMLLHFHVLGAAIMLGLSGTPSAHATPELNSGEQAYIEAMVSIGIISRSDPTNVNLLKVGRRLCREMFSGLTGEQTAAKAYQESNRFPGGISPGQARRAVGYALADLCPDALKFQNGEGR